MQQMGMDPGMLDMAQKMMADNPSMFAAAQEQVRRGPSPPPSVVVERRGTIL
jgi:hypothetical protein